MIPKFSSDRLAQLTAATLAVAGIGRFILTAARRLPNLLGWEADNIARAIAGGHGFSFRGDIRWLWMSANQPLGDPTRYFPTAWVDPVFTYLLAGAYEIFPQQPYLAIVVFNFICLVVVFLAVYFLGTRFGGPWMGAVAVGLLALHGEFLRGTVEIYNTAIAACVLVLAALAAVRYLERSTPRRLTVLGLTLGFAILACPIAKYFGYGMAIALIVHHWGEPRAAMLRPLAMVALAALVLAPWAIRNYVTFGEWVPVRNGSGQIAWVGTVGIASTFMPQVAESTLAPPWRSSGPREAVRDLTRDRNKRIALSNYQVDAWVATPPPGYEHMNEAQRDKLYLKRTKEFIRAHPLVAAELGIAKFGVYLMKFRIYGLALMALALLGAVLAIRDRRSWPLSLAALSYSAPFVLVIAYYDRYRIPIEPVLAVLATAAFAWLGGRLRSIQMRPKPQLEHAAEGAASH